MRKSTNRIAIIGANESIDQLIQKAKGKGLETHVFAKPQGDPGETSADFFYPISIEEKDQILEACRQADVDGVASVTSDFAVDTVNYVARNLGLTGNSEKTDLYARNKYYMRRAFEEAGLFTPWYVRVQPGSGEDWKRNLRYPLIVKPVDRWSSKGITRLDSETGLEAAVSYAMAESLSGDAIIEGFVDGPEYSCECICFQREYRALAFTKKETTGSPHYIETGHRQPSDIPNRLQEAIQQKIFRALNALDIENGAAHAEFRILPDGDICMMEIGARMGGDCIGTDLVKLSTGYDYLEMVLDVALGRKPDFAEREHYASAQVRFILSPADLARYEQEKREGRRILREFAVGALPFAAVTDSSNRNGYYICVE